MNIKRENWESEKQYIWRLASAKDAGLLDMNWDELADIFNKELREDSEAYNESAYRKPYQYAKSYYEDVFSTMIDGEYSSELLKQKDEVYKAKRQLGDQRREYNKILTHAARTEHLYECLIESANKINKQKPLNFNRSTNISPNDNEALLILSDWHYGMVTDNIWNTYNVEICKRRVQDLTNKAKKYFKLHNPKVINIFLAGDFSHGAIHCGTRVASEEYVSDQLMHVSEIIAEMIAEFSTSNNTVNVYSTYGNHMRTVQNKKDSIHEDNMERILPWWLEQRFSGAKNVNVLYSEYKEFTKIKIYKYNIVGVHGDLDGVTKSGVIINTIFNKKFGETIDYVILGDKHHLEEFENFDIESILVRSLCGADEYANEKRLFSNAGQTLMFFSEEEGRECTYNIRLE